MNLIMFAAYYIKLRLGVLFGTHQTPNPLAVRWRWKYWNYNHTSYRKRR